MKCNQKIYNDITQFMQDANVNQTYLFGGAVLDPLINENAPINDYDLCVKDEENFYKAVKTLKNKGYHVSDVVRTHNVYAVVHSQDGTQFDFSCMNPEDNGIFNIEKIYARFPQNEIIDKYDAINGLKSGKIRLACDQKKEGAYNILRRFIAVTAKYGIPIEKGGVNQETIDSINKEFAEELPSIPQDKVRCLDRLLKCLGRSKNKPRYVKNFAEQGLLKNSFPTMDRLFQDEYFQKDESLNDCKSQNDILKFMLKHSKEDTKDNDTFVDMVTILINREKARADPHTRETLDELLNQKTSPQRLQNSIISPLTSFIMNKNGKAK